MWGTVTVGSMALREEVTAGQAGSQLVISGQESYPPSSIGHVEAAHANLTAYAEAAGRGEGPIVPVTFTDKAGLTGFYRVTDAASVLLNHAGGTVLSATWSLALERLGGPRDVEVESFVTRIGRQTALAVSPVFWQAPATFAFDYFTGSEVPSQVITRQGREGLVQVYAGLPVGTEPCWTVQAEDYLKNAAVLVVGGYGRVGEVTPIDLSEWEVQNGLVRLTPADNGKVTLETWDGPVQEWVSPQSFDFGVATTPELTVLRNDPEEVVIRLTYPTLPGRLTVDLGLRRGSRFVTGVIKRHSAATLAVGNSAGGSSPVTGGRLQTDADANGNRWVLGSAAALTGGSEFGISKSASVVLDFFIGHEVAPVGGSPAAGDAYDDLLGQYLGSTGERGRVVKRA